MGGREEREREREYFFKVAFLVFFIDRGKSLFERSASV